LQMLSLQDTERVRALVAEDDRSLARSLVNALGETGAFECDVVFNVKDALVRAAGTPYDLVSADLRMNNLDLGWAIIAPAKEKNPDVAVLVYTMHERWRETARLAGAHRFLLKGTGPVTGEYVAEAKRSVQNALMSHLASRAKSPGGRYAVLGALLGVGVGLETSPPESARLARLVRKLWALGAQDWVRYDLLFETMARVLSDEHNAFTLSFVGDHQPVPKDRVRAFVGCGGQDRPDVLDGLVVAGLVRATDGDMSLTEEGERWMGVFSIPRIAGDGQGGSHGR
jgi:CheY-like chemotaxis protein